MAPRPTLDVIAEVRETVRTEDGEAVYEVAMEDGKFWPLLNKALDCFVQTCRKLGKPIFGLGQVDLAKMMERSRNGVRWLSDALVALGAIEMVHDYVAPLHGRQGLTREWQLLNIATVKVRRGTRGFVGRRKTLRGVSMTPGEELRGGPEPDSDAPRAYHWDEWDAMCAERGPAQPDPVPG